ncbi:MAG: hypothetical protein Q8L82_11365, partial [Nitrosomonas sp.]|nr:hypothetical protein [Nitrosomonas sp.]
CTRIVSFVVGITASKCLRQVSPRGANPHLLHHNLFCHSQFALVIIRFLYLNLLQLRPELFIELQSGHRKLVLLVVWVPQYYEFVSIY